MAGFNADESLTKRVAALQATTGGDLCDLLGEVLAVLEGRLMIDADGMLRLPCDHAKSYYAPSKKCMQCGNAVPIHYLLGEKKAAKWASDLLMAEIHWSSTPQGVEYWQQVYKNLRSLTGSPE